MEEFIIAARDLPLATLVVLLMAGIIWLLFRFLGQREKSDSETEKTNAEVLRLLIENSAKTADNQTRLTEYQGQHIENERKIAEAVNKLADQQAQHEQSATERAIQQHNDMEALIVKVEKLPLDIGEGILNMANEQSTKLDDIQKRQQKAEMDIVALTRIAHDIKTDIEKLREETIKARKEDKDEILKQVDDLAQKVLGVVNILTALGNIEVNKKEDDNEHSGTIE